MIGYRIGHVSKDMFFNAPKVMRAVDAATHEVLSRFGAFVMTAARQSIKKAPFASKKLRGKARTSSATKTSTPGNPPYSQTGTLKRFIYFGYDAANRSVVIGPTRLGAGTIPATLEYGGFTSNLALKIFRKVGDSGEIRLGGPAGRMTKKNRFGAMVTYAKLKTQAQADRANELQSLLYNALSRSAIAPRSFMHPALKQERPKLPAMWANSVKPQKGN